MVREWLFHISVIQLCMLQHVQKVSQVYILNSSIMHGLKHDETPFAWGDH